MRHTTRPGISASLPGLLLPLYRPIDCARALPCYGCGRLPILAGGQPSEPRCRPPWRRGFAFSADGEFFTVSGLQDPPYRYESRGHTPLNLALFAVGLALLALAAATTDFWLVFLPLAAFALGMGYLVVCDPRVGLEIDQHQISFWDRHRRETIPLADIERVHIEHWSESDDVTIHRRDGAAVDVPSQCRPASGLLSRVLKQAGLTVTER